MRALARHPAPFVPASLRRTAGLMAGLLLCLLLAAPPCRAQALGPDDIALLFPPAPHDAGTAAGVTVDSRARPLYAPRGVRLGLLEAHPHIDLGFGFDSNPTGLPGGRGGAILRIAPSLVLGTGWGGDRVGLYLGLDNRQVLGVALADRTDWTTAAGLRLRAGADRLRLTVASQALHEDGSEVGALPTDRPLAYRITALRAAWRFGRARLTLSPALGFAAWRYAAASLGGLAVSEAYRNRDVAQAALTTRYALASRSDLVLVLRGTDTHYVAAPPGAPSRDSTGVAVLAGIEGGDGILQLRLLAGWEERRFAAAVYGSHAAPITEAQLVWTPAGMTTVTTTLSRRIEDAATEGVAGFTATAARLRIDHEARRNLLLSLSAGVETAQFTEGGGHETGTELGASLTWLLNRRLRVTAAERFTALHGAAAVGAAAGSGSVSRSLSLLTLGLGL